VSQAGDIAAPLLELRDLRVRFPTRGGDVHAVSGLSLSVGPGETVGVVGESGSGKSVTFMTVMGLIDRRDAQVSGEVLFKGRDLLAATPRELRRLRGRSIAMVFQDPMTALHPMFRIGDQIAETIRAHSDIGRREAGGLAVAALARVGIPAPEQRARQYSHELSGGMRQRAMIAMALCLEPQVLIADEPTTALDVTVQAQVLELLAEIQERSGLAVVLITHDLGIVAQVASRTVVMYAGRAVEVGSREQVFSEPRHPYTWGLLDSIPRAGARAGRLVPIPGSPPSLVRPPPGCPFGPRCAYRMEHCASAVPPLVDADGDGHADACHLPLADKDGVILARRSPSGELAT
jgi:peptide/nickel transport system ATP-binding protein